MPDGIEKCSASISFQSRIFTCGLHWKHEGDHKATGGTGDHRWTLSWTNGSPAVPFPVSGNTFDAKV